MNKQLLSSLGLTEKEAKLYNAVLKLKQASPATLAKIIGIKRTTAYHTARILVEKGLLRENLTKRPRMFSVASPQDIQELISREQKQFAGRAGILNKLSDELSRENADELYPVSSIHFVEEEKIRQFLYRETMKWHESAMKIDATWWGFQDHTFINNFGKITNWYLKRIKKAVHVKLLSNESDAEKRISGKYLGREIKFWNKTNNFLSTTWIVGNYVIMVNTRKKPFYLVEMQDVTLANDLREVFKNLWPLI
jgi:sugar-specific transcriptional regulator TrmB